MWAQVSFVLSQSTCLTDGQTAFSSLYRALHYMESHGKNCRCSYWEWNSVNSEHCNEQLLQYLATLLHNIVWTKANAGSMFSTPENRPIIAVGLIVVTTSTSLSIGVWSLANGNFIGVSPPVGRSCTNAQLAEPVLKSNRFQPCIQPVILVSQSSHLSRKWCTQTDSCNIFNLHR